MVNSRAKGARGEREFRDLLREAGYPARRGQQFCGANGDSDVICEALNIFHFEVKWVQNLNITNAMEQASSDKKSHQSPVIAHKKDRKPVMVTMLFEDWVKLVKSFIPPSSKEIETVPFSSDLLSGEPASLIVPEPED